jgi:hypothetical protein
LLNFLSGEMKDVTEDTIRQAVVLAISDKFPVVEVWEFVADGDGTKASRVCFRVIRPTAEKIAKAKASGLEAPYPRSDSYVTVVVNDGVIEVYLSRMQRTLCNTLMVDYADPESFNAIIEFVTLEHEALLERQEWRTLSERRRAARSNARTAHHTAG